MTSFIIDYIQLILISIVFLAVLAAYQKDGYSTFMEITRNFYVLIVFGFAALPFTYVLSFLFQIPSTGLVRLSIAYIVSGVFCFMAYFILNNELLGLKHIAEPLGWIFLIFPHYSLARGLSNLNIKQSTINVCTQQCSLNVNCPENGIEMLCQSEELICDGGLLAPTQQALCSLKNSCCDQDFFTFKDDGIATNLVALGIIGVVSFLMLFAIEYRWLQNFFYRSKKDQR